MCREVSKSKILWLLGVLVWPCAYRIKKAILFQMLHVSCFSPPISLIWRQFLCWTSWLDHYAISIPDVFQN